MPWCDSEWATWSHSSCARASISACGSSTVAAATVELPDALIDARARELWDQVAHSLAHQGITKQDYLRISGQEEDAVVEAGKEDAAQGLRREAVLAAIVDAEGLDPTEEELLEAVEKAAPSQDTSPKKLLERLKSAGRLDELKADLAQRRAMDLVTESAKPVAPPDS